MSLIESNFGEPIFSINQSNFLPDRQLLALCCFVLFLCARLSDAQEAFDFMNLLHKKEEKKKEEPKPKKYDYHSKIDHHTYHHHDDDDDDDHWGKPKYKPIFKHHDHEDSWWTTTTTTPKPTTKKSIIPKELSDIVNGENMNFVSELMPQIPDVGGSR